MRMHQLGFFIMREISVRTAGSGRQAFRPPIMVVYQSFITASTYRLVLRLVFIKRRIYGPILKSLIRVE